MPQILSICTYAPSACLKHGRGHDEHWHIIKEWLMICGLDWFSNFHYVWWWWEDAADRVISWFGWKKGLQKLTKCCFSIFRNTWGVPDFAVSKDLSHAVPSANTLVAGKQNSSFNLIQSPPTLPAVWSYQIFASPLRENGESFAVRCFGSNRVWLNSSRDILVLSHREGLCANHDLRDWDWSRNH